LETILCLTTRISPGSRESPCWRSDVSSVSASGSPGLIFPAIAMGMRRSSGSARCLVGFFLRFADDSFASPLDLLMKVIVPVRGGCAWISMCSSCDCLRAVARGRTTSRPSLHDPTGERGAGRWFPREARSDAEGRREHRRLLRFRAGSAPRKAYSLPERQRSEV
jgi:hypothetical protein